MNRSMPLAAASLLLLLGSGCGYTYYAGPLRPSEGQEKAVAVVDDGAVTYTLGRFEVRLRPMTDAELNRQFASHSRSGPASTNPFTFGNAELRQGGEGQSRFTVFHLNVKNYAFPRVQIDPTQVELTADNGRRYWTLDVSQLKSYYRAYVLGYRGNEYDRYQERIDLARRNMFRKEAIFSGQELEGYLVFPVLHPDVSRVEVTIHDTVLRFDHRNEPVETVDIRYRFEREVGRLSPVGTRTLSTNRPLTAGAMETDGGAR